MSNIIEKITSELHGFTEKEQDEILKEIRSRRPTMTISFGETPRFLEDYTQNGYDLTESGGMEPTLRGEFTFDFVPVIKPGETPISGSVMRGRAVELGGNRNQKDREIVLANQHLIPASLRGKWLLFPATTWRDRDSRSEFIPIANWSGGGWVPDLASLGLGWGGHDLLLVPRK